MKVNILIKGTTKHYYFTISIKI